MNLEERISKLTIKNDQKSMKRSNYIEWTEYFMALAILASKRSKDPNYQVGACIVNKENKVIGMGYNGMPYGCSDDEFPWSKGESYINNKKYYVCHAEMNAILNKNALDAKECSLYVVLFPCNECAKLVIQSGIKEVVYLYDDKADKDKFKAAKIMFDAAGVKYWQFQPKRNTLELHFVKDQDNNEC